MSTRKHSTTASPQAGHTTEDHDLAHAMRALDPDDLQLARMERVVLRAFEAEQRSLATEWIDLLRVRPVVHGGYALAAAALLLLLSPLGMLPLTLLRRVSE
jgi:hypothetical protein